MDVATTKLLSIHVSALLPPTSTELDVPHIVQVAAVLGVGLVYQGTAHRHMAEVLLSEIGKYSMVYQGTPHIHHLIHDNRILTNVLRNYQLFVEVLKYWFIFPQVVPPALRWRTVMTGSRLLKYWFIFSQVVPPVLRWRTVMTGSRLLKC